MDKKKLIAIIAACAVAVGAAVAIPVSIVNCKKDNGQDNPNTENPPGPDEPENPDKPAPPTPPAPGKDVTFDYISDIVNLDEIDEGATAYCAATFNYNVYQGGGVYSETQTQDYYLIGAYVENAPTRFYVFDGENKLGYVTAYSQNGSEKTYFSGKTGGIAANNYCMWIAAESKGYALSHYYRPDDYKSFSDRIIQNAANSGEILITDTFNTNCNADFIYYYSDPDSTNYDKDALFIGEYHGESQPDTDHKIEHDKDGEKVKTNAYLIQYKPHVSSVLSSSTKTGLVVAQSHVPTVQRIYTMPDNITGFAVVKGDMLLTDGEKLFYYDWNKINGPANVEYFKTLTGEDFKALDQNGQPIVMSERQVCFIESDFYIKNYQPEIAVKWLFAVNGEFCIM